jgi:phospholipase/carboxylesterase
MTPMPMSRRRFATIAGGGLASLALGTACTATMEFAGNDGRLSAKPKRGARKGATAGERKLGLDARRDAVLFVPSKAATDEMPLLLLLHGAGGAGERILARLRDAAEETGVAVLAPDSRDATWDAITLGFGSDVGFIDRALSRAFDTLAIDPNRVAIGGFSDGASYALSLGLVNGDLFQRILAFSPGFLVGGTRVGKPSVFISHGRADQILPLDQTSRLIVPGLTDRGYDVTFREFEGGHEVPPAIAKEGLTWVAHSSSSSRQ